MKKFVWGTLIGAAVGALGYKVYKDNEEEVKEFLDKHIQDDVNLDLDEMDIEGLEELRNSIDETIERKEMDIPDYEDDMYDDINDDLYEDYVFLDNMSHDDDDENDFESSNGNLIKEEE
ncbi:hypothetical protein [Peptostreptococcus faecalis]|uniref:hypothetical protein n=1 Tax=Peptostreptococcus faecalis TaxID=2045015 RepID=UPI000C7DF350|nr:hypothetical protein [Peptostreptococcus faecalis]